MASASRDPYTPAQAASWDGYYGSDATAKSILYRRRLTLALELLDQLLQPSDGPVADLGCGAGQLTTELVRRGFAVMALDYSAEMLRLAEQKLAGGDVAAGRVSFIHADLNVHELPPAQLAAVCALGCLEFLRDVPAAIAKLAKGVRRGGYSSSQCRTCVHPSSGRKKARVFSCRCGEPVTGPLRTIHSPIVELKPSCATRVPRLWA